MQQSALSSARLEMAKNHQSQGNYPLAEKLFLQVLKAEPENIEANLALANICVLFGRQDRAGGFVKAVLTQDPENLEARIRLAGLYHHFGYFDEAAATLSTLVEKIDDINTLRSLSQQARYLAQHEVSIKALRRLLDRQPDSTEAHTTLGTMYLITGEKQLAQRHLERAVQLDRRCTQALFKLAQMNKAVPGSALIKQMEELSAEGDALQPAEKMYLYYGLAKVNEDLGTYDKAFSFLLEGNRIEGTLKPYNEALVSNLFSAIKQAFSHDFLRANTRSGSQSDCPILVVGMPRSGTTLTEQILASHPSVCGAGELGDFEQMAYRVQSEIGKPFPQGIETLEEGILQDMASRYLDKLAALSDGELHVVDKMPHNFVYLGLIQLLFPNARIIHCRRNPMDCALSIFKSAFNTHHSYSHDLTTMGRYFGAYMDLMNHWRSALPSTMYEIDYEKVVGDTENEIRALLAYCGLPFDAACLESHKTTRSVDTASHSQVRSPINSKSVAGWKKYERQMQPFIDALGENATGLEL